MQESDEQPTSDDHVEVSKKPVILSSRSNSGVSSEFKNDFDNLLKEMEAKFVDTKASTTTPTVQQFKARPRGRRPNRIKDEAENIGIDIEGLGDAVVTDAEELADAINAEMEHRQSRGRRRPHRKLAKFIFKDMFGRESGAFLNAENRAVYVTIMDIQANCIKDVSKARGLMWRVFGYNKLAPGFGMLPVVEEIGAVYAVGYSTAAMLATIISKDGNYKLAYMRLEQVNVAVKNGRR